MAGTSRAVLQNVDQVRPSASTRATRHRDDLTPDRQVSSCWLSDNQLPRQAPVVGRVPLDAGSAEPLDEPWHGSEHSAAPIDEVLLDLCRTGGETRSKSRCYVGKDRCVGVCL